jgi:hypothetical protein
VGIEVGGAGGGGGGGGSCHTANAAAVVVQLREGRHVGILQDKFISIYNGQRKRKKVEQEKDEKKDGLREGKTGNII